MHSYRLQKWVLFCRLRSYTYKDGMASSPEIQPELCPQLKASLSSMFTLKCSWVKESLVVVPPATGRKINSIPAQTRTLVMPRQGADGYFDISLQRAPLIQSHSDLQAALLLQSLPTSQPSSSASKSLLLSFTTTATPVLHQACITQAPHAKSFLYHYPYFLPSNFVVLTSSYLSAQFCSAISALAVLPNLCSCQHCLLWPVVCLESVQSRAIRQ